MFKFLRKYNKWILAVGGTLLMIVFLVPQAIQGLSEQAGQQSASIAVADGERVTRGDWDRVRAEVQLIQRLTALAPGVRTTLAGSVELPEHWLLLVKEADEAGLIGGELLAQQLALQLRNAPSLNQSPQFIASTLTKIDGVNRLSTLYAQADKYSDRRLRNVARREFLNVNTDFVVLQPTDLDDMPEPTDTELAEHLAAYGDLQPGAGDHGFGYKLPPRFKIETLAIDAAVVREHVRNSSEMDEIALRRHWRENEGDAELGFPTVASGPVPDVVREHLLEDLTARKLDQIAKFAYDELRKPQRPLSRVQTGHFKLPDDWTQQRLAFPDLANAIQEKFGIATPVYEAKGDEWLTLADIEAMGSIARAATDKFGNQPMRLVDLIRAAKEFEGSTAVQIQSGVAGPPLRSAFPAATPGQAPKPLEEGEPLDVYLFRIIDTDPARAPESVDEVREQLVRDVKRLKRFRELVAASSEIEAEARKNGLLTTALSHDTVLQRPADVAIFPRSFVNFFLNQNRGIQQMPSSELPVIGAHDPTIRTILDYVLELPEDAPLATLPPEQRIFTIPVEDKLALVIVELNYRDPLSAEDFDKMVTNGALQAMLMREDLNAGQDVMDAFSVEAMKARHDFAFIGPDDEVVGEDADDAQPDETAEANVGG